MKSRFSTLDIISILGELQQFVGMRVNQVMAYTSNYALCVTCDWSVVSIHLSLELGQQYQCQCYFVVNSRPRINHIWSFFGNQTLPSSILLTSHLSFAYFYQIQNRQ